MSHESKTARTAAFSCAARVLREVGVRLVPVDLLEAPDQLVEVVRTEIDVLHDAFPVFQLGERLLEPMCVDSGDHVPEHLNQAPVGVPGEALVPRCPCETRDGLLVQAEVQDGVHHPGHRDSGSGAHRHEEWVARIAEPLARRLLEPSHVLRDLFF